MSSIALKKSSIYIIKFLAFLLMLVLTSLLFVLFSLSHINDEHDMLLRIDSVLYDLDDKIVVIIDAGHGGEDGGAVSDSGIVEKDLNLDIALKIKQFLSLSSIDTVMIRDTDKLMYLPGQEDRKKYYDISNRISIAEKYDNAFFVSIHQNKFPIKKYSGFQVYCSKNDRNSLLLGNIMQSNIRQYLQPHNNRDVKIADKNIRILDSLNIPAIIAECGFLSNDSEAQMLADSKYRNKLAFLIYSSIIQFAD